MSVLNSGDAFTKATLGIPVRRATGALPQTTTADIFSVDGGKVLVTSIYGEVTTAVGAVANATKLTFDPDDGGSDIDLCATLDVTGDVTGTVYSIVGVLATALQENLDLVVPAKNLPAEGLVLTAGDVKVNCAGSSGTGAVQWTLTYVPIDLGATVTAV